MNCRTALTTLGLLVPLAGPAAAQSTVKHHWAINANKDIYNINKGHVGINTNDPRAPLHVEGGLILTDMNGPVGLSIYPDATHQKVALAYLTPWSGAFVSQRLDWAHTWIQGDVTIDTGGLEFGWDLSSITFPPTTRANAPMIEMFASGTQNSDRMVLAHSPAFPDWGLMYRDTSDEFHFVRPSGTVMMVDLSSASVGVGTTSPSAKFQVGNAGDGTVAKANAWLTFSSREFKTDIEALDDADRREALEKVVDTPVYRYRYKGQPEEVERLGLIVEESPADVLADDGEKAVDLAKHISLLHAALQAQQDEIVALREELESLRPGK